MCHNLLFDLLNIHDRPKEEVHLGPKGEPLLGWTVQGSNPVEARFSAPVQTGPEAHPTSYTIGTGSFPG